jgi:hypothetical protein
MLVNMLRSQRFFAELFLPSAERYFLFFCEIGFVLCAQTRFHAFLMSVMNKTGEVLFISSELLLFLLIPNSLEHYTNDLTLWCSSFAFGRAALSLFYEIEFVLCV